MLTEKDFCDYETCVALKELGFKERCVAYYDTADNVGLLYNTQYTCDVIPCQYDDLLESRNSATEYEVDAPTIYEAQKWLREKDFIVLVDHIMTEDGDWCYNITHLGRSAKVFNSYEEALSEGVRASIKLLKEGK